MLWRRRDDYEDLRRSQAKFREAVQTILDEHQPEASDLMPPICRACGEHWPCQAHSQVMIVQDFVENLEPDIKGRRWWRR